MEKQLVPQLRFPSFNLEKYFSLKFGSIIKDSGYGPRFNGNDYDALGNVKTIRGTDISLDGEILYDQVPIASLEESFIKNHILKNGDLVMITTADCGLTGVFRQQDINYIPSAYAVKISLIEKANPIYFKYFFQTTIAKNQINRFVRKATVANLPGSDISKLNINIPSLPEQQKIASFLTDVDEVITKLTKKKTLLEQYKKGIMQKIFNQEIRFKDVNSKEFPEWEEKKLSDLGFTLNGLTGKTKEDFGEGKPYIQYKQIFDSSKININKCGFVEITSSDNQTKMQYGDVFFTTSSETPKEIGTASVLLDEVDEMYLNSFCFGFRVKQSLLYPPFSQFLFRSNGFRKKMIPLAQGSTRYNISKSSFLKLKVYLPSIEEQTKIANFLSDIDLKIEALGTKIENSKTFKKGLLQQMFV